MADQFAGNREPRKLEILGFSSFLLKRIREKRREGI